MQVHPVILLVCIHLLWLGCSDKSTTPDDKKGLSKVKIDSLANLVLQEKIDRNGPKFTDATTYGLLYNHQIQKGRSGAGDVVFDKFDRFLKDSFLDRFNQARTFHA
jgi:hypothetical protein